jgi:phosphatidylserine decarboxylase
VLAAADGVVSAVEPVPDGLQPGDRFERGQRIGMIRFGSRVDVTLPAGIGPGVVVGQRMRAGLIRLDG